MDASTTGGIVSLALVATLVYMSPPPTFVALCNRGVLDPHLEYGIQDEQAFYFNTGSLVCSGRSGIEPHHPWTEKGLALRKSGTRVVIGATGMEAYFAGPHVHLVDNYGLADPLLARLPFKPGLNWRIGHFYRGVPQGYMQSIETGENLILSQSISQYYEKLHLVTSGPIWSAKRFAAIWELNSGNADSLMRPDEP